MGILGFIFGDRPYASKKRIAGLAASCIDDVLKGAGPGHLSSGSLVLDKRMRVSFRSGRPQIGRDFLASVPIGELSEFGLLKKFTKEDANASPLLKLYIDQVVYAVIRRFEKQSLSFAALPSD